MYPKSHEIYILPRLYIRHVRTCWIMCGELSPQQCTKGPSVLSIGRVRIFDLVHFGFETTPRRTKENTFKKSWAIKVCTKFDKKSAETYELLEQAYGESVLSCVQFTRWVILRRAKIGWTIISVLDGYRVTRVRDVLKYNRPMSVRFG